LIWINLPAWGSDLFAPHHLAAQVLLDTSIWLPVHAFRLLTRLGHPGESRADEALVGFEKTSRLVSAGAFRYIRHPMYWGVFLQQFTWLGLGLVLAATALLVVTAFREEQECLAHFGEAYSDYMGRTRRFVISEGLSGGASERGSRQPAALEGRRPSRERLTTCCGPRVWEGAARSLCRLSPIDSCAVCRTSC
ncbi:MAG TPA: isoprenylcysteine carboxylmethyltransferase family protein, partial [Variovorax sp.]